MGSGMPREALLRRQRDLLARSAQLRADMALRARDLAVPMGMLDQVGRAGQWLAQHPQWPVGIGVALVVWRPKRALLWGRRLWWAWRMASPLRRWLQGSV